MLINNKLYQEILDYCKINNLEDVDSFINELIHTGFMVTKFGTSPFDVLKKQKQNNAEEKIDTEKKDDVTKTKPNTDNNPIKNKLKIIKNN